MTLARSRSVPTIATDTRLIEVATYPPAVVSRTATDRRGAARRWHTLSHSPLVADIQRHGFAIGLVLVAIAAVAIPLLTRGMVWVPR